MRHHMLNLQPGAYSSCRIVGMFTLSREIRQVLVITALGQEGEILSEGSPITDNDCSKVEFTVNDVKQNFSMKLGEGGEAFFVFETSENVPRDLQTSPLSSPTTSPAPQPTDTTPSIELPEPEPLDLAADTQRVRSASPDALGILPPHGKSQSDIGRHLHLIYIADEMLTLHRRYHTSPRISRNIPTATSFWRLVWPCRPTQRALTIRHRRTPPFNQRSTTYLGQGSITASGRPLRIKIGKPSSSIQ
jgi:hypothetical protein